MIPNHPARRAMVLGLAVLSASVWAQTPAERGLEIAREAERRDDGWGHSEATLEMTLRSSSGHESLREMRSLSLEINGDGDRSLIVFDHPKDVRGTAVLTFSHKSGPDDQWLFLPALGQVKPIASNNKSGPFMSSEFAFEDISSQELEKYSYKYLRDEMLDGKDCFVIERYPVDTRSGYSRQVVWMDKAEYRPQKIEFYDRGQSLLKTLSLHDYKQYKNRYWRTHRMEMVNHQTRKSTTLRFSEISFDSKLSKSDFDPARLDRVR